MAKPILYLLNGKVAKFGNSVLGTIPPDVYTVTIDTVSHGSISASPVSGIAGTTITLSNTPDTGYELDYFTVNGVAIVGNSFTMPAENVTVGAVFIEEPLFREVTIGNQVWADRNLSIDDGEGDIYINNGIYYYGIDAATRIAATIDGWRVPTKSDFDTLTTNVSIESLASIDGWTYGEGTNTTGFNAIPNGHRSQSSDPPYYWGYNSVGIGSYFVVQPFIMSRDTFYGCYVITKWNGANFSTTITANSDKSSSDKGCLRLIKDS